MMNEPPPFYVKNMKYMIAHIFQNFMFLKTSLTEFPLPYTNLICDEHILVHVCAHNRGDLNGGYCINITFTLIGIT